MITVTQAVPGAEAAAGWRGIGEDQSGALADLFAVVAEPTRWRMLLVLAREGEKCVGELSAHFGCPQPTMSHHLAALRQNGLAYARRAGRNVFYSLGERVTRDGGDLVIDVGAFAAKISPTPVRATTGDAPPRV